MPQHLVFCSTNESHTIISLIQYIPLFIHRNPKLAKAILKFDHSYVTTGAVFAIREKNWDKRRKERSVWVRPYLLHRRNFGQYDNLMRELVEEDLVL